MEVTWRSEAIVFSFDENCPQNKPISASAHAFLVFSGYLWFSMGNIKVATWNGLKILIPKHMWKSKIGLLEQIWGQNPYDAFFLGHPVLFIWDFSILWPTWVSDTINFSSAIGPDMSIKCCWRPLKCHMILILNTTFGCLYYVLPFSSLDYNQEEIDLCPEGVDSFCSSSFGPYLILAMKP